MDPIPHSDSGAVDPGSDRNARALTLSAVSTIGTVTPTPFLRAAKLFGVRKQSAVQTERRYRFPAAHARADRGSTSSATATSSRSLSAGPGVVEPLRTPREHEIGQDMDGQDWPNGWRERNGQSGSDAPRTASAWLPQSKELRCSKGGEWGRRTDASPLTPDGHVTFLLPCRGMQR